MFGWISKEALFALKIVSFCISSITGLLSLLFDFKDKETRKLTGWGKLDLSFLLLAAIVGTSSQLIDNAQQKKSAEKADVDTRTLLGNTQTLLDKTAEELGNVKAVIASNTELLGKTDTAIAAEAKTDKDTQRTLTDVDRSMQLVGDTIRLQYSFIMWLPPDEMESLIHNAMEIRKPDAGRGGATNEVITTVVREGQLFQIFTTVKSSVVPQSGDLARFVQSPRINVTFQRSLPGVRNGSVERFVFDESETERLAGPHAESIGFATLSFTSQSKGVFVQAYGNVLRRLEQSSDYLSTSDFYGRYLTLGFQPMSEAHIELCDVGLVIGTGRYRFRGDKFRPVGALSNLMSIRMPQSSSKFLSEEDGVLGYLSGCAAKVMNPSGQNLPQPLAPGDTPRTPQQIFDQLQNGSTESSEVPSPN